MSEERTISEQELIDRCRQNDQEAFLSLVRRHEQRIAATVIGMLGPCAEADDIGQETFIRFFRHLDSFHGESSAATYLTRIAVNLCINEINRRKRQRLLFPFSLHDQTPDLPAEEYNYEHREQSDLVQTAMQKLTPKLRSVLVLRLIDGYSIKETAAILKIAEGTVLSRLARAQEKLQSIVSLLE
jgi:RNA polymerase sigma-70 factor, ECF subfamily